MLLRIYCQCWCLTASLLCFGTESRDSDQLLLVSLTLSWQASPFYPPHPIPSLSLTHTYRYSHSLSLSLFRFGFRIVGQNGGRQKRQQLQQRVARALLKGAQPLPTPQEAATQLAARSLGPRRRPHRVTPVPRQTSHLPLPLSLPKVVLSLTLCPPAHPAQRSNQNTLNNGQILPHHLRRALRHRPVRRQGTWCLPTAPLCLRSPSLPLYLPTAV